MQPCTPFQGMLRPQRLPSPLAQVTIGDRVLFGPNVQVGHLAPLPPLLAACSPRAGGGPFVFQLKVRDLSICQLVRDWDARMKSMRLRMGGGHLTLGLEGIYLLGGEEVQHRNHLM